MPKALSSIFKNPTVFLAVGLMFVIVMMVLPMPSWVLDVGLSASFAFAILIFTITLFIERPLDFSSFPSVLLAALLLRLSLNISSTKLIIGEGHTGPSAAGGVIEGFAMFVMGGNIFIGLIVFSVLVIVNFMVIAKGAGRMAEVGARFALDAMPGKQMAIDADLSAGAISHAEASARRITEQEETAFLGSLDGVSKFMKGDAVAGILITLLNLIAGIGIGVGVHGISLGEAVKNYSVLTVGDGLVSQIPAVIISIAAGLLLSKGRGEGTVDFALFKQFSQYPAAIGAVSGIMLIFAFFPGLPFLPFMAGAMILAGLAYRAYLNKEAEEKKAQTPEPVVEETPEAQKLGDALDIDEISVELAPNLVPQVMGEDFGFDQRVQKIRKFITKEFGFILPAIRLTDNALLDEDTYKIKIQGTEIASQVLKSNKLLVLIDPEEHPQIPGINTREPVFQAPARWVDKSYEDELMMFGLTVIAPIEVLATHLLETIQDNFTKILSRRTLRHTLDTFKNVSDPERAESNEKIIKEFIPDKVPLELLQGVCRLLLEERISIRNIPLILELVAEGRSALNTTEQLADFVRHRISYQFVSKLRDNQGRLPLVQIGPTWETHFQQNEQIDESGRRDIALPPDDFNRLAKSVREQLDNSARQGVYAAIATTSKRRRFIRSVLNAKGVKNPVVSYEEIGASERPAVMGVA
ncbi:flagellar biosynthesis protein FlhA [Litorimonas taeanensis]|uniref:Flagellar biosynthesis protein FlhA n=1 Tax=Litorimonas taeanensis TaxID=568099 RepID=A0A420WMC6_9PROT|nr:flagellar biosynthesis protein FlhA [Litorimonas taeanensis]RKQ72139.1 flagellar biosynthesis protein FlhA [Litorimonas taeanensis]